MLLLTVPIVVMLLVLITLQQCNNSVWSLTSGSTLHVTLWARTALGGRIGARAAGRPARAR